MTTFAEAAALPVHGRPRLPAWLRAARRSVRRLSCAVRLHADPLVTAPPRGVEERWLTTRDRVRIHAWYAPAPDAVGTLVWSHGFGLSIARRPRLLQALAAQGVNVLAYDYRGCGGSGGRLSKTGWYLDALAAYDSERARGVPPGRILAFGESLGGAVAIHLATQRPCAGVVAVSPVTRLADLPQGFGPLARLMPFDSLDRVRHLTTPILIAHGDRDGTIPFDLGLGLFAAANEPKKFFRAAGARHHDVFASSGLLDAIGAFARRVANDGRKAHAAH